MQLEIGISWPHVLDRQLTMVKRALKRDVGPEVRAKEANPEDISVEAWETKLQVKGLPVRSAWAYAWAVLWMLRCVELVNLRASDGQLNFTKKTASVNIRKSKMDQKGLGVKRTLQCFRGERCSRMWLWNLALRTLAENTVKCDKAPLFPDLNGTRTPKVKMIKSWMEGIDDELTGHSARRSGAIWYARKGMPGPMEIISGVQVHRGSIAGDSTLYSNGGSGKPRQSSDR